MNREIKFRAWDIHAGCMYDWDTCYQQFDLADLDQKGLVWMQYTELKDKNGTEIYEGDIVNLIPDGYVKELAFVCWNDSLGSWNYRRISSLELINGQLIYPQWKPLEVIGNIYENPELLAP